MRLLLSAFVLFFVSGCYTPKTVAQIKREVPIYDVRGVEGGMSPVSYWRDYKESADSYRPCDTTLALGYGDCDDYVQCAKEMTEAWPCEEKRIVIYEPHYRGYYDTMQHAVYFLRCNAGKLYGYFDNGQFIKGLPR